MQLLLITSFMLSLLTTASGCSGPGTIARECGSTSRTINVPDTCCSGLVCNHNTKECIEGPSTNDQTDTKLAPTSIPPISSSPSQSPSLSNDAIFTTPSISLTVTQDGTVSLTRTDNDKVISTSKSTGWTIYNMFAKTHTKLDTMVRVGPNELQLSSSDGKFNVNVAITVEDRYIKFELIHVSNNPQTGELDDDWPGHRVIFDVHSHRQSDGWKLHTLLLNPMSELRGRDPYKIEDGIHLRWPYPQWAQTDDRPQLQGAVAAFGFMDATEHDDILKDIWVAEKSLPRPDRKNHQTSWTRDDIDEWLGRWHKEIGKKIIRYDCDPQGVYKNLFIAADLAYQGGMNAIYLSQHSWQSDNIGDFNSKLFPNGRADAIAWREYCDARGISIHFHGFAHLIRRTDPYYGRGVVHNELASSAAGTLLEDVPAEAKGHTFLVEPDLDYMLGMKEGMLPFYDIRTMAERQQFNGGVGATYPPYFESLSSLISLDKNLYKFTASITSDNKWKIVLGDDRWSRPSTTPLVDHVAGTQVKFILTGGRGRYYLPDSRSNLLVEQAERYAQLLNDVQTSAGYDGAGMTEDLGSWGLRRFSQEVAERMDHPGTARSSFGIHPFGHFEFQFNSVRASTKQSSAIPMYLSTSSALAPGLDAANQGACKGAKSQDISLRSIHGGLTRDTVEGYGMYEHFGTMLLMWSQLKPYLSTEQAKMIAGSKDDFYAATETEDQWKLTKTRAMRRPGIDGNWNTQPERPDVAPRQYLKANGEVLYDLVNPYDNQNPVVELHVMADMSDSHAENMSLMPTNLDDIINPVGAEQTLDFSNGKLTISVDNSESAEGYEYYTRKDNVGYWLRSIDMSTSRGVAITVNGDGSGSTLVLSTGGFPRMYAVDIDFVGERTIEIPNGEVCNNRDGWNIKTAGSITQFNYDRVDRFRLFLHKVPAVTKSVIEVTKIVAMNENRDTGLINPELTLIDKSVTVQGTIPYDHYLVYSGGETARIYDSNWNELEQVFPVTGDVQSLVAIKGSNSFSINAETSDSTWLSLRIKVEDTDNPIIIQRLSVAQTVVEQFTHRSSLLPLSVRRDFKSRINYYYRTFFFPKNS